MLIGSMRLVAPLDTIDAPWTMHLELYGQT